MTQYDNTNRGAMFENDRKTADSHPDIKGKLNVDGVDRWVSGWWKEAKNGSQFLSLSLGQPVEQSAAPAPAKPVQKAPPRRPGQRSGGDDMSDVPFSPLSRHLSA